MSVSLALSSAMAEWKEHRLNTEAWATSNAGQIKTSDLRSKRAEKSRTRGKELFQRRARQIEEFFEAGSDGFAVGVAAVVIEENNGRVFCALARGGDPIPGVAAGGGETETGAEIFLVRQLVEGFEVQGLETVDLPELLSPAGAAGLFELEAGSLDAGMVLVELQESFREKITQFPFDCLGLRVQETAKVGIVGRVELIRRRARAKPCYGAANAGSDDEEDSGECQGAEDEEEKFIHALIILREKRSR
jgi:hypothetical protein